jgi:hypothetical protein
MERTLCVLDEREVWQGPLISAARQRGWHARRVLAGYDTGATEKGFGFIRPHADPARLRINQSVDDPAMRARLRMFQDRAQIEVYENKTEQWRRWGRFMPETWLVTNRDQLDAIDLPFPLVSKANEGASSVNVRILGDRDALRRHSAQVFTSGISVNCCAGSAKVTQKDYLFLQRFIPHEITWRVNIVGRQLAIFRRFCYPTRPVAQTGNVEPVKIMDAVTHDLLQYAGAVFAALETRWCAIDVLRDGDRWRLLETSLAWPWPSPGDCDNGVFFIEQDDAFVPSGRRWIDMMDVLLDEAEADVWNRAA